MQTKSLSEKKRKKENKVQNNNKNNYQKFKTKPKSFQIKAVLFVCLQQEEKNICKKMMQQKAEMFL